MRCRAVGIQLQVLLKSLTMASLSEDRGEDSQDQWPPHVPEASSKGLSEDIISPELRANMNRLRGLSTAKSLKDSSHTVKHTMHFHMRRELNEQSEQRDRRAKNEQRVSSGEGAE